MELGLAMTQVAVTTIAATALGGWLLRSRLPFRHPAVGWAVQAALGFLVVSYTVFGLALLHLASRVNLRILSAVLGLIALVWLGSRARSIRRAAARTSASERWLAAAGLAYGLWMVACATLPPLAVDELNHHLAVPGAMLEAGGAVVFLDNIYAYFPPLGEMLFLFGLGVGGETAARLFHTASAVLLALSLLGFSRRYLPRPTAAGPVVVFFAVPSVMVILPWAYVDLMFTLYAFLALILLLEFFESRRPAWVALSGVMAGGALATKYTGLQLVMMLALLVLGEHLLSRRKRLPAAVLVLIGAAALVALPYLWRNWQLTGWPLFPFALGPLPLRPEINWNTERASMFLALLASYGSGATPIGPASLWDSLAAPVLVFLTARFNDPRLYDGIVGPVFLLAPLVLWRRPAGAALGALLAFSLIFLLYWGLTIRQIRFLIPVLPVLSLLVVVGLHQTRSRLAAVSAGLCVAWGLSTGVGRVLDLAPFAFWSGVESREAYLERRVAGFPVYQAANRTLGRDDRLYLVNMRNYGYYLRRPWRADFVFEAYTLQKQLRSSAEPRELAGFFASQGVTHLLIDERAMYSELGVPPDQRATLQRFLERHATVLFRRDGRALYRID